MNFFSQTTGYKKMAAPEYKDFVKLLEDAKSWNVSNKTKLEDATLDTLIKAIQEYKQSKERK